jgi:peptidyl-dipeptidase A
VLNSRAQWVNSTYITDDTDALAAHFGTIGTEMSVRFANEAARYADVPGLDYDTRRKLDILRSALVLPAPTTEGAAAELNTISTRLQSTYGKGRGTLAGKPMTGNDLEEKMGTVRNPAQLQEMWTSWHTNVGRPMRPDYARLVEIANQGAKELGYPDTGAMWRSRYDMPPDEFAAMTDRLWNEVKPLYDELHCFTRAKLNGKYGDRSSPRPARSAPTCSATCGPRNGAISTTSSRPRAPATSATTSPSSRAQQVHAREDRPHRRELLQLAGLRSAAADLLDSAR